VLVSDARGILTIDPRRVGNYSFETLDYRAPDPTFDIATSTSRCAYLDCLKHAFLAYRDRVEGTDFAATFDFLVMHTPFAGLVKAGHRKMMREFAREAAAEIEQDFHATGSFRRSRTRTVPPGRRCGCLCRQLASAR